MRLPNGIRVRFRPEVDYLYRDFEILHQLLDKVCVVALWRNVKNLRAAIHRVPSGRPAAREPRERKGYVIHILRI